MAYDEGLAQRIREIRGEPDGLIEKKMFGGLAFIDRGNMAFGVASDSLMVRVGPEKHEEYLALPHARPMDFTGRPMKGMIFVDLMGVESDDDLRAWLDRGFNFTQTLPSK